MAETELGLIFCAVDVRTDDTVEVSPADREADRDTALVGAFDVVGGPGDGVRDTGVDARGAEEGACVLDVRVLRGEEHAETCDSEQRDTNVAPTALAGLVGHETDDDGQESSNGVRRNREQVGAGAGETELGNDGGEEEGECVQSAVAAHVNGGEGEGFPVLDRGPEIRHFELFVVGGGLGVCFQTADHAATIVFGQELGFGGEVLHHPVTDYADDDGGKAFEDEDPGPTFQATDALHLGDGGGEQTTERSGERGSREEDGSALAELRALVPAGKVVVDTGCEDC